MGRPINKNILSNVVADILLVTSTGNVESTATITKQVGSKRFHLSGYGNTVFTLVAKAVADLAPGEMSVRAFTASSTLQVAKITQRKLTAGDGTVHAWSFAAPVGTVVQVNNTSL